MNYNSESGFETNGFYTERGFYSERYMDELKDEIVSLEFDYRNESRYELESKSIMNPHKRSPLVKEIMFDGVLRGIINKFLGNHFPIQSQLRFKPPLSDGFPYHQDDYWIQSGFGNTINVLVYIDESTIDNGCIYVLSKSHKPPFYEDRVYITAKPGDVTFFHNYVLHASDNNNSDKFRKNLLLSYVKEGCEFRKGGTAKREIIHV
jgi:hypothetical protein